MFPYQAPMLSVVDPSWRPNVEIAPNCPRCDSSNTKFCYYNNYSLSQPRYFCKGCRRYWTRGGALRNVPIGGGCRKTRRRSKSAIINRPAAGGSSLRPDHVLDGMGLGQNLSSSTASDSSASAASSIDMAELYTKYLNPKKSDGLTGKKRDDHIAEELFVGELDFCDDYFFDLSACTAADSAFALPGSSDGFEIDGQSILSNQYWSNYEESSFEAICTSPSLGDTLQHH